MDARRSQRIEFLDSIRGLAALSVLCSHAVGVLTAPPLVQTLLESPWFYFTIDGKAAVAMFFVLSGFVLSRPYLKPAADGPQRPVRFTPFYIKRITRIYFPFFSVLALSAIASLWLFKRVETIPAQTAWFKQFWSMPWTARDFLKQCFFLLHNADWQLIPQDWTLGVELKASALLPFLLLALRRSAWLLAVIGLLIFFLLPTGHYYFGFIMGIFLAAQGEPLLARLRLQSFKRKCLLLLAGIVLYAARTLSIVFDCAARDEKLVWLVTSIGCLLVLFACFSSKRIQKALQHASAVFIGRISYGVYLLQFLVILVFTPWFVRVLNHAGLQSPMPVWCLAFLASVGGTILAGAIFFKVVEQPSMQFGHSLAARCSPKTEPGPAPAPETPGVAREP